MNVEQIGYISPIQNGVRFKPCSLQLCSEDFSSRQNGHVWENCWRPKVQKPELHEMQQRTGGTLKTSPHAVQQYSSSRRKISAPADLCVSLWCCCLLAFLWSGFCRMYSTGFSLCSHVCTTSADNLTGILWPWRLWRLTWQTPSETGTWSYDVVLLILGRTVHWIR